MELRLIFVSDIPWIYRFMDLWIFSFVDSWIHRFIDSQVHRCTAPLICGITIYFDADQDAADGSHETAAVMETG